MKKGNFVFAVFLNQWGTLLTLAFLLIFFSLRMPSLFLSSSNLVAILRSISIVTIIAVGITLSLVVDGLDLSVGAAATFSCSLVVSMFVWYQLPTALSLFAALFISLAVAGVNIFLIIKMRIPDLLATLSSMFIFQGVSLTYTGGGSISEGMAKLDGTPTIGRLSLEFKEWGQAPGIIFVMIFLVAGIHIFLSYTKHGRFLYVIGGNREAARLSGIPVDRYRGLAYLLSTLMASLGGILLASRIGSSQINAGAGYLMPAVAASFIGFSVMGQGKPNVLGTFVGAVLVGVLENGLVMMSVPYYSLNIIKGAFLSLALALTYYHKNSK